MVDQTLSESGSDNEKEEINSFLNKMQEKDCETSPNKIINNTNYNQYTKNNLIKIEDPLLNNFVSKEENSKYNNYARKEKRKTSGSKGKYFESENRDVYKNKCIPSLIENYELCISLYTSTKWEQILTDDKGD